MTKQYPKNKMQSVITNHQETRDKQTPITKSHHPITVLFFDYWNLFVSWKLYLGYCPKAGKLFLVD